VLQEDLLNLKDVTSETVRATLDKHGVFVLVTPSEHARLGHKMTVDWTDPLERFKIAKIEVLPNPDFAD
jgi:hypothetical protein